MYETLLIEKSSFDSQFIKTNKKVYSKTLYGINQKEVLRLDNHVKNKNMFSKF